MNLQLAGSSSVDKGVGYFPQSTQQVRSERDLLIILHSIKWCWNYAVIRIALILFQLRTNQASCFDLKSVPGGGWVYFLS